jgi:hypothetical protein
VADALKKLEEALQRNTAAFSGRPGLAHATEEGEDEEEEGEPAVPTGSTVVSVTPQEGEEMFPDSGTLPSSDPSSSSPIDSPC